MEAFLLILELLGGLIMLFAIGSLIGLLLKLKKHFK